MHLSHNLVGRRAEQRRFDSAVPYNPQDDQIGICIPGRICYLLMGTPHTHKFVHPVLCPEVFGDKLGQSIFNRA